MKIVNGVVYVLLAAGGLVAWKHPKGTGLYPVGQWFRQYWYLLLLLAAVNTVSMGLALSPASEEILVEKEDYSGQSREVSLELETEGQTEELVLSVRARELTPEQQTEKMEEAFAWMEENLKGENEALSHVTKDLNLSLDVEEYPFDVELQPEIYGLIREDGTVENEETVLTALGFSEEEQQEGIATGVTVVLRYGDTSQEREFSLTVFPREQEDWEQAIAQAGNQLLALEEEARYKTSVTLPSKIGAVTIAMPREGMQSPGGVLILGLVCCVLLVLRQEENRRQQEKKRQEQLRRSYPWFVNELLLFLGAGMQVKNIFSTMVKEYDVGRGKQEDYRAPLMEELRLALHNMSLGMGEEQVYALMGRRLKLPCYIKLLTLLEQNVRRGTKGLVELFEQEELAALEERKNLAKRYGEEAGTKLLGPLILLLVVVMLMIMIPAFLNL
jgi:hypothetical protein